MVDPVSLVRVADQGVSPIPDAVVIGGGLAGAAFAAEAAKAGRHVVLCERETGPHDKVCGEFLSREAALYLEALGLDLQSLGAQPISRLRLAFRKHQVATKLPFQAQSLSRRVLDAALLDSAAQAGAEIRRGAKVQALEPRGNGWCVRLFDGAELDAKAAFLATGKHDLRGWSRPEGVQHDLIGFKLHWRLDPTATAELTDYVELFLFSGGYAGLELVEDGMANLCLLVRQARFVEADRRWDTLLAGIRRDAPLLDRRLEGATQLWRKPLAIAATPYGHLTRDGAGPWRLGDQAAVIPSFAGDGMSIALHSARLAAGTFLAGGNVGDYQRQLIYDIARPVRFATLLSLALVDPMWQAILGGAARLLPGLAAIVAGTTRVPAAALRRTGLKMP